MTLLVITAVGQRLNLAMAVGREYRIESSRRAAKAGRINDHYNRYERSVQLDNRAGL
jgi:hypothetical protein